MVYAEYGQCKWHCRAVSTKIIASLDPYALHRNEFICYKVTNSRVKAQVALRDDATLASAEVKERWKDVVAAIDKELRTWAKLGCVSRKGRSAARNIIDARWALK